jgi:hypothetical protein
MRRIHSPRPRSSITFIRRSCAARGFIQVPPTHLSVDIAADAQQVHILVPQPRDLNIVFYLFNIIYFNL